MLLLAHFLSRTSLASVKKCAQNAPFLMEKLVENNERLLFVN
jgi:hypothetical protein